MTQARRSIPIGKLVALIVVVFAVIGIMYMIIKPDPTAAPSQESSEAPSQSSEPPTAEQTDPYHPSDEIIDPYDISKNPYLLRGHSGILDTVNTHFVRSDGTKLANAYPGGALRFKRMLDEHTAIYAVVIAQYELVEDEEIAVILSDSKPPSPSHPWRIYVEGPLQGTNGFGAPIQITAVRFEGYYVPETKPAPTPPEASPSASSQEPTNNGDSSATPTPKPSTDASPAGPRPAPAPQ